MRNAERSLVLLVLGVIVQCNSQCSNPIHPVKYPDDDCANIQDNEVFDFIVCGAGPGGSAVARRLAECPNNKVLLLEAGQDPPPISDIGGIDSELGLEYRWDFQSYKDGIACGGYTGDVCRYNPGKVLGGSTVVNAKMAVRGNPEDYEEWKRMGNTGWGYQDVLPYFKKLENYIAQPIKKIAETNYCKGPDGKLCPIQTVSSTYHATGGPVTISKFPIDPKTENFREPMIEAYKANGINFNPDVNTNNQMGVTTIPGTIDKIGYRFNAAKAYLLNKPENLKICKFALVHKLNLDTSKKPIKVTSVKFAHSPQNSTRRILHAFAIKEYILSGGVFGSPGILERSGIGEPDILKAAGVEPKHTLNVGENYQDQFGFAGSVFIADFGTDTAKNPLTIGLTSLTAFYSIFNRKVPDCQFYMLAADQSAGASLPFKPEVIQDFLKVPTGFDVVAFSGSNLRQGQFGSVHITQSEDPLLTPKIDLKQFTTQHDTDVFVNSTRLARKIMAHPALKRFKVEPIVLSICKKFKFNSKEEIMCGVKNLPYPLYHQSGTCYMGPSNSPQSVVDPQLRVIGIRNLRVADTSIMPLVTRSNTAIPAMMIGEKAADMIKSSWGQLGSC